MPGFEASIIRKMILPFTEIENPFGGMGWFKMLQAFGGVLKGHLSLLL